MNHTEPATIIALDDKPSLRKKVVRYVCVGAFGVSFLAASLIFGLAISHWSNRNNEMQTDEPAVAHVFSTEEFEERYTIFRSLTGNLSNTLDLVQSHSAQSRALEWLVYQDTKLSHVDIDLNAFAMRYALMVLFYESGDDTHGQAHVDTCDWDVVICGTDRAIRHLNLQDSNLIGSIPNELGLLSSLVSLDLSGNELEGTVPKQGLVGLTNLESINLARNDLAGNLPSELGLLSRLTYLDVSQNLFDGELPQVMQKLSNLKHLHLSFNAFQGKLFEDFARFWKRLEVLQCQQTEISGILVDIPTTLQHLDISSSPFSGTLENLPSLSTLTHLRVASNDLTGPLPDFVNLPNVETLSLEANPFTGTISSNIGILSNLEKFQLVLSDVHGSLPSEIGLCTNLNTLHLTSNSISGTIPSELGNLSKLRFLTIQRNRGLTGGFPSNLCPAIQTRLTVLRDCTFPCDCCKGFCY